MSDGIAKPPFWKRLLAPISSGLLGGLKASFLIVCVMVPVSLAVLFLDRFGLLSLFADIMAPFTKFLGLPGKASLVFIASIMFNIYGAIAVMDGLPFTMRELTILALMCLTAHNLVIETALMKKTKSSAVKMVFLRLFAALAVAWVLNFLLPWNQAASSFTVSGPTHGALLDMLGTWSLSISLLAAKIAILVISIKIGQKLLEEFNILNYLAKLLSPFVKIFGLAGENTDLWVVMNALSYANCAALVSVRIKNGQMRPQEADLLNHHASMMHSLVKDTLPFMLIGLSLFWLVIPRIVMALCLVWMERIRRSMFKRSFRIGTK